MAVRDKNTLEYQRRLTERYNITPKVSGMIADAMNLIAYSDWLNYFELLAENVIDWRTSESWFDEEVIEQALFNYGECAIIKANDSTYHILTNIVKENLTSYTDNMTSLHFTSNYPINGELSGNIEPENYVIIKNNTKRLSTFILIESTIRKLSELDRITDLNLLVQKTPFIIVSNRANNLTLNNLIADILNNEAVISATSDLDLSNIKVLDLKVPYLVDKFDEHSQRLISRALTIIGVNNNQNIKKERLIVDEANANNMEISLNAFVGLSSRRKACKELKRKFDIDVTCNIRSKSDIDEFLYGGESDV